MTQRWEIDEVEWDSVRDAVRERLSDAARHRGLVTYSELAEGLPFEGGQSHALHEMLGELQRECHAEGSPLLSALAVYKDSGEAGPGFTRCAKALGYSVGDSASARFEFWAQQVARCHDAAARLI